MLKSSPDRMVVVAYQEDGSHHVLGVEAGVVMEQVLLGHTLDWNVIAVSKQYVVSNLWIRCSQKRLMMSLWDVTSGKQVRSTKRSALAAAISYNYQWIACSFADGKISLFEILSGKAIGKPLIGHTSRFIRCIAFSSDDRFVISGADDSTVRIWDVMNGKEVVKPLQHDSPIESLYVSRDDQQLISFDWGGKASLWNMWDGKLLYSATKGLDFAHLLSKAKNGWQVEETMGIKRSVEKTRVLVRDQNVYIYESREGESLLKIGQFDVNTYMWTVDAKGNLWVHLVNGRLATLRIVDEQS